jgi:hypothetical protein
MRTALRLTCLICLVPGAPLLAQTPAQTPAPSAPASLTLDVQLGSLYSSIRRSMLAAAEGMPAEHYAFRPVPEVRTFGEAIEHIARSNTGMCNNMLGRPRPADASGAAQPPASTPAKADLTKMLADSFALCDQYASTLKSNTLAETYEATRVGPDGTRSPVQLTRAGLFATLIAHNNEVYGYLAVYLRLKGIVPPTSATPARGRGRGGSGRE